MEAPAVMRRRPPFLAPIWMALATVLVLTLVAFAAYSRVSSTTVVLVRHAEKQLGTIDDPPLTPEGEARAQRLARMFGPRGEGAVQAIYATPTRRAQATAAPLAARLGLTVIVSDQPPAELARRIRREQRGGVALVIGHSNTVPVLASWFSGRQDIPAIAEDEYSTIYVVTLPDVGRGAILHLTY
jgi:broad specificity phosphatase PhoE